MPESGIRKLRHEDILSIEEIEEIIKASAACGINKVRITGGEPLVRRGIIDICRRTAAIDGIREVCLTTNGILLPKFAAELKAAGVNRINISLDSLDRVTYNEVTRFDAVQDALKGLFAALETGFDAVKINTVLIGGVNEKSIREMLDLTLKHNVDVRFIELMPIGQCTGWSQSRFIGADYILTLAPNLSEIGTDGVTKTYRLPGAHGTVGLINPISSHFCPSCNRIRITSDGTLKPCLHSAQEINLRGLHGAKLEQVIRDSIYNKPEKHEINNNKQSNSARNMNAIGG